jgi:hypothetical protein
LLERHGISGTADRNRPAGAIVSAAAERIADGETIILDGGTTGLAIAECLLDRVLTVCPLSLRVAFALAASPTVRLLLPGGVRVRTSQQPARPVLLRLTAWLSRRAVSRARACDMRDSHLRVSAHCHAGNVPLVYDEVDGNCSQERFPGRPNENEVGAVVLCHEGCPHGRGF